MINRSISLVLLATFSQSIYAQFVFDNPRLDAFVADLTDRSDTRHYRLVSKQSAIHQWLIRDCMRNLGFDDEVSSEPKDWREALYGKYAYCQDHHIPGIDPPCPSEDIVENSMNNSCFKMAHDKIDWSHEIMHSARKHLVDDWTLDISDPVVQVIESSWSSCMERNGFSYKSRFEMYSSFGEARTIDSNADASATIESEVFRSAEQCFDSTDYYQKRKEYANSMSAEHLRDKRVLIEALLDRYEAAERFANDAIANYCKDDRPAIVHMYEQEKQTDTSVCD